MPVGRKSQIVIGISLTSSVFHTVIIEKEFGIRVGTVGVDKSRIDKIACAIPVIAPVLFTAYSLASNRRFQIIRIIRLLHIRSLHVYKTFVHHVPLGNAPLVAGTTDFFHSIIFLI